MRSGMAELPTSKSGLKALAKRGQSAARRAASMASERRESRNELVGALVLLPITRDVLPNVPLLGQLGLNKNLELAVANYALSSFTRGMISDAAWGATLGAVGAYSLSGPGLLGGLFGGGNGNGG